MGFRLQDFAEDMMWLAMPEKAYAEKQKLGESFRVEQCPMLVFIDPEGNVVTTEGTEIVTKDPDGRCHCITCTMRVADFRCFKRDDDVQTCHTVDAHAMRLVN